MTEKKQLLVLVHPGSCCGSADFNLGRKEGMNARVNLVEELDEWRGDLLIIHNDFADEISRFRDFDRAIRAAIVRAGKVKVLKDHDESPRGIGANTKGWFSRTSSAWKPGSTSVSLTGAWHHVGEEGGCVNFFRGLFENLGFESNILDSAVILV